MLPQVTQDLFLRLLEYLTVVYALKEVNIFSKA
jgi:hypothetical protein